MNTQYHIPVLLDPILEFFKELEIKNFVDGTLGAGGHSKEILKSHPEIKMLIGFDQDESALKLAKSHLEGFEGKVTFVNSNFYHIDARLKEMGVDKVDGILLDLGVSSMQLDYKERGFSFSKEGPLDMRMDQRQSLSAETIVNEWPEKKLEELFRDFGDTLRWRTMTRLIVEARKKQKIKTTTQLVEILKPGLKSGKSKIHPATLVFQTLRIAVNNELNILEEVLPKMVDHLNPKGRLGVISFHSGEDRIVKNAFRDSSKKRVNHLGEAKPQMTNLLTKKPIIASEKECRSNPRSRSAKLRFVEKI